MPRSIIFQRWKNLSDEEFVNLPVNQVLKIYVGILQASYPSTQDKYNKEELKEIERKIILWIKNNDAKKGEKLIRLLLAKE